MKRLSKTISFLYSLLAISETPIKEGKLDLSSDQKAKVISAVGEKDFKLMVQAINKEATHILNEDSSSKLIKEAREEFLASLKESGYTEDEIKDIASDSESVKPKAGKDESGSDESADASLQGLIKNFKAYQKKTDSMIAKLINEDEPDPVNAVTKNGKMNNIEHSATHLFGKAIELNAFEGRSWNKRAAGLTSDATVWEGTAGEVNLGKLNGDVELFYRQNPSTIESLHRDTIELPAFWPTRLGVVDRVSEGKIMSDEITQSRKLPWLPKNSQRIQPEIRQIFDVSIDLEWVGNDLQKYEKSWLQSIISMEGSSPYKMTFVQFLVTELMKKAKAEDRMSAVKGVYVQTPDDATIPGRAINRQNGLLYQLFKGIYIDKKVKVPSIGLPTPENIVDYVRDNIEINLDEEIRDNQNLVYYLEPEHMRLYIDRKEMLKGVYNTTNNKAEYQTVDHYPNIRLEPLHDLAGTNVHIITFDDNIEILEDTPNEKGLLRFEMLRRIIYGHADYKFGCGFIHLGTEVADTDPDAFKVQTVWTNGVFPFKKDFFIPFFDDKSGKLKVTYSNLNIISGFSTNITLLDKTNLFEGQVIRVKGNASNVTSLLKMNITFLLASDFDLASGGTITLVVTSDMKLKEVKRTNEASASSAELFTFNDATLDLVNGVSQSFDGSTAVTLAAIENGIEQQMLTLYNSGTANFTVANIAGVISVDTTAVLAKGDELVLVLIDGVWTEYSRLIASVI